MNSLLAQDTSKLNTWIEIDRGAIAHNLGLFRNLAADGVKLMPVVKANAYGHGLEAVSHICAEEDADYLAVHSIDEAHRVRGAGVDLPVLIMGPVLPSRASELAESGFEVIGYEPVSLMAFAEAGQGMGKQVKIHLKVETGTNRQGVAGDELLKLVKVVDEHPGLKLEGVYTHFANIEDTTDHSFAMRQLSLFTETVEKIKQFSKSSPLIHASCSAAGLLFPEAHFDILRVGISLYGLWPSRETLVSYKMKHGENGEDMLMPAMTWKTRVGQVKTVPKDAFIGYGLSYKATHDTKIAVLPVGYSDGIDRGQSSIGAVLIGGCRAHIRGRVCMNLTMVDITDIPDVKPGDEAVILGRQGDEEISADHLASHIGSINYEVVTRISPDITRVVV